MTRRLMALIRSLGALILTHGATTRPGTRTKNLYVVRLDDAVWDRPQFRKKNPGYRLGKPHVYVGVTSHNPSIRFEQHQTGYRASRWARRYGRYLMKEAYEHLNPVPADEAEAREKSLALALRRKGWGVWQA